MNKYGMFSKSDSVNLEEAKFKACAKKRFYRTEKEATEQKGQQAYKCPFCDGWHRTGKAEKLMARLRPKTPPPQQKRQSGNAVHVLVCMVSGWELRRYFLAHGDSEWQLVNLATRVVAPQSHQVCEAIENSSIWTDHAMHDGAYQLYYLTPAGRKKANKAKAR